MKMKLGIFECGYMPKKLQVEFISYPKMLKQAFSNIGCILEYVVYDVTEDRFPKNTDECDAYITTGSFHSVNDDYPWIVKLQRFVQKCSSQNKKLVGICFGHQLLAKALGGEVEKSEKGVGSGIIESKLLQHQIWMQPEQNIFKMIISHEDQITKMPKNAILLANNKHCENFMMQINENFLGIQGHPELTNEFIHRLMMIRAKQIPEKVLKVAYNSLSSMPDNALIMKWIVHFLRPQSKH